jgi:hypothetical protein
VKGSPECLAAFFCYTFLGLDEADEIIKKYWMRWGK